MSMGVKFLRGPYSMAVEGHCRMRRCASENSGKVYVSLYLGLGYCRTTSSHSGQLCYMITLSHPALV